MMRGPSLTGGLDNMVDAVCLPDCDVLPVTGDNRQLRPEEAFLLGIIEQAVLDYLGTRPTRGRRGTRTSLQLEAEVWFTSGNTGFLSFRWVCSVLGLDPSYIWGHRADWKVSNRNVSSGSRHRVGSREAA